MFWGKRKTKFKIVTYDGEYNHDLFFEAKEMQVEHYHYLTVNDVIMFLEYEQIIKACDGCNKLVSEDCEYNCPRLQAVLLDDKRVVSPENDKPQARVR